MSNAVLNPDPAATVTLRGVLIPLASDVGGAFISDCARNKSASSAILGFANDTASRPPPSQRSVPTPQSASP